MLGLLFALGLGPLLPFYLLLLLPLGLLLLACKLLLRLVLKSHALIRLCLFLLHTETREIL